jgi:hypothetical protein
VVDAASLRDLRPETIQIAAFDANSQAWVAVTDKVSGLENSVPSDGIVRVTIKDYPHTMVTGSFFAWLPGYRNGTLKLRDASLTMRRE